MGRRLGRPRRARGHSDVPDRTSELRVLLSPETAYSDPFEIVADPALRIGEKRAILARWLARICATEAALGLKWMPATSREPMQFDDVMDALRTLDQGDAAPNRRANLAVRQQKSVDTIH